jgi:5-methylcytosine-specific restriction endonuclease McrA
MTKTVPHQLKHQLLRMCKANYRTAGHDPNVPGTGLTHMVSVLSGRRTDNKDEAWIWLHEEFKKRTPTVKIIRAKPKSTSRISKDFYASEEWRRLRYRALRESKGCCALCGRTQREHGVVLHVDHIKPRSRFPSLELDLSNLQILCEDCNLGKSNFDSIDWRQG